MEAIIGVVILFWIISAFTGAFGKQGQQRKMNRPQRQGGLPPFGNPNWPTLERNQPQSESKGYSQESRTEQEIYQQSERSDIRSERKVTDGSGSNARYAVKENNQKNQKNDRTAALASLDISISGEASNIRNSTNQQKPALLDQQQLVNGIIWSEILGPPKSRRRR